MLTSPTREKQILTNLQYRINFKIWNHLYTNTHKKITPSILRKIKILELFEKSQQQFQLSYRQIKLIYLMITWLKVSSFQDHLKNVEQSVRVYTKQRIAFYDLICKFIQKNYVSVVFQSNLRWSLNSEKSNRRMKTKSNQYLFCIIMTTNIISFKPCGYFLN